MVGNMFIFGPLAAMYGRDIEQELMRPNRGYLISEWKFNGSVDAVNYTLRRSALTQYQEGDHSMPSHHSDTSSARRNLRR